MAKFVVICQCRVCRRVLDTVMLESVWPLFGSGETVRCVAVIRRFSQEVSMMQGEQGSGALLGSG